MPLALRKVDGFVMANDGFLIRYWVSTINNLCDRGEILYIYSVVYIHTTHVEDNVQTKLTWNSVPSVVRGKIRWLTLYIKYNLLQLQLQRYIFRVGLLQFLYYLLFSVNVKPR